MSFRRKRNDNVYKKIDSTRKAKDVLYEKMIYYHTKGQKFIRAIETELRSAENKDVKLILQAAKLLKDIDALCIDCASKLIPYQTPKLESIEVNKKVEHRYVIRVPPQMQDPKAWLAQTGKAESEIKTIELPAISPPAKMTLFDISEAEEIEDIEDQRRSLED